MNQVQRMDISEINLLLQTAEEKTEQNAYQEAFEIYERLLVVTEERRDDTQILSVRFEVFKAERRLLELFGKRDEALAICEQYLLEAANSVFEVDALVQLSAQLSNNGNQIDSITNCQRALELAKKHNDSRGRALALGGMGLSSIRSGRMLEAIGYLQKALALFEQMKDINELVTNWVRLGVAHSEVGEVDKAIDAYESAYNNALGSSSLQNQQTVIYALNNIGESYQDLFMMEKGLEYHRRSLKLAQELELVGIEADICRNVGVELTYLGEMEDGLAYLKKALDLSEQINDSDIKMQSLYSLALGEIKYGDTEQGLIHARELKELADKQKARAYLAKGLHALGHYYEAIGDKGMALQHWQQALFLAHETDQRMLLWQLHVGLGIVSENAELASVHNRIAAEVIDQIAFPIKNDEIRKGFLQAATVRAVLENQSN